jgi:peptidoglycan hydrolase CwlO-like protein
MTRQFGRPFRPRAALVLLAVVAVGTSSCMPTTGNDVAVAQTINEMSDAVNELRQENANLQAQIDSLKGVAAKQDTVVRNLAALAGVAIPP